MDRQHPARRGATGFGRRFTFGLLTSLSITLVAFEWRSPLPETIPIFDPLPPEEPVVLPRVIVVVPEKRPALRKEPTKSLSSSIIEGEPDQDPEPEPSVGTEGGNDGPDTEGPVDGPGPGTPPPPGPWGGSSTKPYFADCLKRAPNAVDECTEHRIGQHLQRHFRPPSGLRGDLRTVVFFEVDAEGRIGRLTCSPRVDPLIEREVERVLRALPSFVPGDQNGQPVPVYYRIPLVLRRG